MRIANIAKLAMFPVLLILVLAACETNDQEPDDLTLEQILERSQTAMGEVTSYKTRGTIVVEGLTEDDGGSGEQFTAWQSPDRWMLRVEGQDPDSQEAESMEIRRIGSRSFASSSGDDWQEITPSPPGDSQLPGHLQLLAHDSIELISDDTVTEDGTRVFELRITPENRSSGEWTMELRHILLVDFQTYRFVHQISDEMLTFTLHSRNNRVEEEIPSFAHTVTNIEYYDYDQPVRIEIPDEYTQHYTLQAPVPSPTPIAQTLEEILENTLEAMGAVTTYQTEGTISTETHIINTPSVVRTGTYATKWREPRDFSAIEITSPEGLNSEPTQHERRQIAHSWYKHGPEGGWQRISSTASLILTDRRMKDFLLLLDSENADISLLPADADSSGSEPNYVLHSTLEIGIGIRTDGGNFSFDSTSSIDATIHIDSRTFLFDSLSEKIHIVASMTDDVDDKIVTKHWTTDETKTYKFHGYEQPVELTTPPQPIRPAD